MPSHEVFSYHNVSFRFSNKSILDNCGFSVNEGEKVILSGPSGSGKTSLLLAALGLHGLSSGTISFCDKTITAATVWDVRKEVAFVDQDISLGAGLVADKIAYIFALKANNGRDASTEQRRALFNYFGLNEALLKQDITALSGGERQRLALVIAVLLGRSIFLLDEPTSALDSVLKERAARFFLENKTWTVVAVSHDTVWKRHEQVKIFDLKENAWMS